MIRSRRSSRPSVMARTVTKKNPRDLPARREPKFPATVGLSGSGAPSNLRAVTSRRPNGPVAARPRALRPPAPRLVRLAAFLPGGGAPRPGPPCGGPGGVVASALRLPRPQVRFPVLRPSVVPGAFFALRRSRRFIRSPRVGTSTAWSERRLRSEPARGQPDVSAGQSIYLQVTGLRERVTIPDGM